MLPESYGNSRHSAGHWRAPRNERKAIVKEGTVHLACLEEPEMAANPQIPPSEPPLNRREEPAPIETGTRFPWGIIAIVATLVALGLIAYYFFR